MAKKSGSKKGGGRTRFVRDAIGRFARTGGEALGRVAKEALKSGEQELTAVAKQGAADAVKAADAEWRRMKKEYSAARRASEIPDDVFNEIEANYKKAIKARTAARVKLGQLEK